MTPCLDFLFGLVWNYILKFAGILSDGEANRMILTSKITSKGQITLPKEVRKLLNVQEGNVVVFEKENDKIVIKPASGHEWGRAVMSGVVMSGHEWGRVAP